MHIITNHKENHQQLIIELIRNAEEIFIATAFLKLSGLKALLPSIKGLIRNGKSVKIIAGQNFGLTEPQALHILRKLILNKPNAKIYLAHANRTTAVFHPKIYVFRNGMNVVILTGSANLTEGGLSSNIECSILTQASTNDQIWKETNKFFEYLFSEECSKEVTLLSIKQYETYYENQRHHNSKSKAIPTRNKIQSEFNYHSLLKFFNRFNTVNRQIEFNAKSKHYLNARRVLNEIADAPSLSKVKFSELLDELVGSKGKERWWHSGSLFRRRREIYPFYYEFQSLVRYVREYSSSKPETVFIGAKNIVNTIAGAGLNYITEIMMTYNPRTFANLNMNPITVLKKVGNVNIKLPGSFNGRDYEEYCELITEISKKLGLKNMLEADSFFNDIYWKIKKK